MLGRPIYILFWKIIIIIIIINLKRGDDRKDRVSAVGLRWHVLYRWWFGFDACQLGPPMISYGEIPLNHFYRTVHIVSLSVLKNVHSVYDTHTHTNTHTHTHTHTHTFTTFKVCHHCLFVVISPKRLCTVKYVNICIIFGTKLYRQNAGIPMGIHCAPCGIRFILTELYYSIDFAYRFYSCIF